NRNPPPTMAQVRRNWSWVWVHCRDPHCRHTAALALAPLIIRWGEEASSDLICQYARRTACGHKGAAVQVPSWDIRLNEWAAFGGPGRGNKNSRQNGDGFVERLLALVQMGAS